MARDVGTLNRELYIGEMDVENMSIRDEPAESTRAVVLTQAPGALPQILAPAHPSTPVGPLPPCPRIGL